MRYQAEAYHSDTNDFALDLSHWETRRAAQHACEQHAQQTLVFTERWPGWWEGRAVAHWYRIVASSE